MILPMHSLNHGTQLHDSLLEVTITALTMIATAVSIRRTMNLGGFLRRNLTGCSPKRFIVIHPRINTHQHMLESAKVVFVHDTIPIRVRRKCTVDSQSTVGSGMISLCAPTLSWRDLTQRNSMRLQQPCDWSTSAMTSTYTNSQRM